jgi:hypothetical protein
MVSEFEWISPGAASYPGVSSAVRVDQCRDDASVGLPGSASLGAGGWEPRAIAMDPFVQEAKIPKAAGQPVRFVLARLRQAEKDVTIPLLAETHKALATRSQRRCKPAAETQQDLFKAPARRAS